jgi:hypothetical protein
MTDQCRRSEFQPVEQLAVIDDEVEPIVQGVHGVVVAMAGARKLRRIDHVVGREARNERAVGIEPPRPVQINERRTVTRNLDLGFDPVVPKSELARLGSGHVCFRPRSGCGGQGGRCAGDRTLRLEPLRPPAIFVLVIPQGARCGSTSLANRSMFFLHNSVGIEPKCSSESRWPMRRRLTPSMSCSRTVFGLPTMTKPRS